MKISSIIKWTALAALVLFIGSQVLGSFGYRDGQVQFQNDTQAAYNQNRVVLAGTVRTVQTNTGLYQLGMKSSTDFMEAAVSGRYKNSGSGQGSLVFAIKEAYPNLPESQISLVMKEVEVGEQKFANAQNDLSERIKAWDNNRMASSHLIYNLLPWCHFPTDALIAKGPDGTTLHGQAALDHMRELVTSAASDKAYGSNQFDGYDVPKN
jgi:hypothetical protein